MKKSPFYITICDDDEADRRQIEEKTRDICEMEKIEAEISCFENAEEFLEVLIGGGYFDLLLLDVMLPGQSGIELARILRERQVHNSIILISSNREMAMLGYEVEAARYLAKPVKLERLREAVQFCYEQHQKSRGILLPADNGMRRVLPGDIYYIEIVGRKSRICQKENIWDTSVSISELEKIFSNYGFVRCHQSFLVNCHCVQIFNTSSMVLENGRSIPVSKHRIKEVRQNFFGFMKN